MNHSPSSPYPVTDQGDRGAGPQALLFFCLTTGLLSLTLSVNPYWKDAGELITAYATGGLPHPTGSPLLAALAGLLCRIPLGTMALRVNLFSTISAGLTGTLMYLLILEFRSSPAASADKLIAGLISWSLLLTRTVWIHSVAAEVYLPSLALTGLGVLVAVRALASGRPRALPVLGLILGLSAGAHITTFLVNGLVTVLVVAFLFARTRQRSGSSSSAQILRSLSGPLLVAVGLAALAGVLVLSWLPLRSLRLPWQTFGYAGTLETWFGYVSGSSIRSAFADDMLSSSPTVLLSSLGTYLGQLANQAGPALPAALAGLGLLLRLRTATGLLAGLVWGLDLAYTVLLNPMGQVDLQTGLVSRFMVFFLAGALLIHLRPRLPAYLTGILAATFLIVPLLSLSPSSRLLGRDGVAQAYARQLSRNLPPGALVLTGLDDSSSLGLYQQLVENRRSDSLLLVRQTLGTPALLAGPARRHGLDFLPESLVTPDDLTRYGDEDATLAALRKVLTWNIRHHNPIFWEPGQASFDQLVREALVPGFPLCGLDPDPTLSRSWAGFLEDFETWRSGLELSEPMARMVLGGLLTVAGGNQVGQAFSASDSRGMETATRLLTSALELDPDNCRAWNNLAVARAAGGYVEEAAAHAGRAVELCPDHVPSRVNQVRYLILSGAEAQGMASAEAALEAGLPGVNKRLERLAEDLNRTGARTTAATLRALIHP